MFTSFFGFSNNTACVFLYNYWLIWFNLFPNYGMEIWETPETKKCYYHFLLSHKGRRQKLRSGFFSETFFFPKGLKMMFLYSIRLKMDQKGHIIDQKGLKMYEKRQKIEF